MFIFFTTFKTIFALLNCSIKIVVQHEIGWKKSPRNGEYLDGIRTLDI